MLQFTTTPTLHSGSQKIALILAIAGIFSAGSGCDGPVQAQVPIPGQPQASESTPQTPPEPSLGVADKGIFSDLDSLLQISLPADLSPSNCRAVLDSQRGLLLLYQDAWPIKVYPVGGSSELKVGSQTLALRPGDRSELQGLVNADNLEVLGQAQRPARDADQDGIPDALDLLMGAQKTVLNGANYGGGYKRIPYPNGDIPREDGVCTDVVVRAVRNAGLDIQSELQKDIKRKLRAYPMIKKRNPNIDHRRVKTLLPYFKRQWSAHTLEFDDAEDPLRPGDIVFMDTFPKRSGPDHIGVLSNNKGKSGHLLVINNWTSGFKTQEMDLLSFVPVTHRFRLRSK